MRHRMKLRRRRQSGKGLGSWLRKAHDWVKKHKVVSRVGSLLGTMGVPYANTVSGVASRFGYGKTRRRRTGRGLRLVKGGSISRPRIASMGRF